MICAGDHGDRFRIWWHNLRMRLRIWWLSL